MTSPEEFLKAAALTALNGTGTWLRESPVQAGIDTSAGYPAPFIICGDYTTTQAQASSRTSAAAVTLYFADVCPSKADDAQAHLAAIARMEELKRRFLTALNADDFTQIEAIRASPFAAAYAARLDGVGMQFTLTVPTRALC
ncbi:MAG: hypothetical protein ACRYFX_10035 [Janthinobacterium lividum]